MIDTSKKESKTISDTHMVNNEDQEYGKPMVKKSDQEEEKIGK